MHHSKLLPIVSGLFITTLIVSNIIAVKIVDFSHGIFLPAGVVLFPISYILGDVLTEVYGYGVARKMIWTGFLCNLVAVLAIAAALHLPAAPFYQDQAAFQTVLGSTPRILLASFVAFLVGSFANSYVLAKMKVMTKGKHLWTRTIGSTIVGEGLDSLLFIIIAFTGIFGTAQIINLILMQWIFKTAFETIATPLTYLVIGYLKKADNVDYYDTDTNFVPLQF